MSYRTLKVRTQDEVCFVQIDRPQARNTIDEQLVAECRSVLAHCEADGVKAVVLSGTPEVFCLGADFSRIHTARGPQTAGVDPEPLYDLWLQMANGPYVCIAQVRGKVNAGGLGFVAASDIVLADESAEFALSELLFGVFPACVLPFLIRRVGRQRAHYLTLTTRPIRVQQAHAIGLADAYGVDSDRLVQQHLSWIKRLSTSALRRYKQYRNCLDESLQTAKPAALSANRAMFADPAVLSAIARYTDSGRLPWEP